MNLIYITEIYIQPLLDEWVQGNDSLPWGKTIHTQVRSSTLFHKMSCDVGYRLTLLFSHLAYFQEEPIEEHQDEGIDEFSHKVAALRV